MYVRSLIAKCSIAPEQNHEMKIISTVEYYLIRDYSDTTYGICVSKIINDSDREESIISNISCNREYTECLLEKLIHNTVTPIALFDVITDMNVQYT